MSEANTPSSTSGLPNSQEMKPDWGELSLPQQVAPGSEPSVLGDLWEDWQTVDFPNAISIDAIPRRPAVEPVAGDSASSELSAERPAELPPVDELITLIQDLNQCNTLLVDRVSQLEIDLKQRQTALEVEIQRNRDAPSVRQDLTVAQEQIVQLLNQLEFTHQSSQRQQILVETLTEQLESSQERVAQIERECALVQQRYSEQAQQLIESETAGRDLRTRLQRQQRYTLQFKAALEKCLEMPPLSYEAAHSDPNPLPELVAISAEAAPPLVPRVARIQPWSSQPQFPAADLESDLEHDRLTRLSILAGQAVGDESQLGQAVPLDLEQVSPSPMLSALETIAPVNQRPPIALVKTQTDKDQTVEHQVAAQLLAFPIEAIELGATLPQNMVEESVTAVESESESEDALWLDLARMIEVSADKVITVTTKDLTVAEDQPFAAESTVAEPSVAKSTAAEPSAAEPSVLISEESASILSALTPSPITAIDEAIAKRINTKTQANPAPRLESNWPSPVVYPLRPTRKLRSLAAVDLPTFPR